MILKNVFIYAFLLVCLSSCAQNNTVVEFRVGEKDYNTIDKEAVYVDDGEVSYSIKRINESAKKRYEFMSKTLDFMDDFSNGYVEELDGYLILGTKTFESGKQHLYHFFKKGDSKSGISILATCPFTSDEKYKSEIYRIVKSCHF